ncbi:MAG: GNAT family N-acetyltransferase [Fimbriimonadaceae bacterium]|nr:GNAT family N-acetyltransferase [Fimbriimonadaceae bacterium]
MIIAETHRLIIRPWTLDDTADAYEVYRHDEVTRWLNAQPMASIEAQREALQTRIHLFKETYNWEYGFYALELKSTQRVIGAAILKPLPDDERVEIGWHLGPEHWGKGYATESARALLAYGFVKRDLKTIYAITLPENTRSQAVCRRLGMEDIGLTERYHGLVLKLYSLTREDWDADTRSSLPNEFYQPM